MTEEYEEYLVTENARQSTYARRCYSLQNPRVLGDYAEVTIFLGPRDQWTPNVVLGPKATHAPSWYFGRALARLRRDELEQARRGAAA